MENNFENFYNNINKLELEEYWKKAINEKNKKNRMSLITILIVDILVIFFSYIIFKNFIQFLIFPIFMFLLIMDIIIFAIYTIALSGKGLEYNAVFKERIINSLFKNFFNEVDYIPKKQMAESIYREGNYKEYYNEYFSDDYMEGSINGKNFIKMAEITTKEVKTETDSEGNKHTTTTIIFSGLFAKINIGKSIENEIRIMQNGAFFKKNKLEMDSQEFEKYFDIISSNQILGMQLLTHDIMDLLVQFRKVLQRPFDILIKDDIMYIRLHVGKLFEAGVNKNDIIDKTILEKYYNIVDFISSLASEMIKVVEDTEI